MDFQYNEGGRRSSKYRPNHYRCVVTAIAIATGKPYTDVYSALNPNNIITKPSDKTSRYAIQRQMKEAAHRYLLSLGYEWVNTRVLFHPKNLPQGTIIVSVTKELIAVINGVINHTSPNYNYSGSRLIYGYYTKNDNQKKNQSHE